jgi:hypothetical protein
MFKELLPLFGQVPLVAIFAGFVIYRDKVLAKETGKRDKDWQEFLKSYSNNAGSSCDKMMTQVKKNTIAILLHDATTKGGDPYKDGSLQDIIKAVEGTK